MSNKSQLINNQEIHDLFLNIKQILESARRSAYTAVNSSMIEAYWQIGKQIVEKEQKGESRAEYGATLIKDLAEKLTAEYGRGFNKTNIAYMKQFYLTFQNFHALRGKLTWTHYRLLLKIDEPAKRVFYMTQANDNNWSTRQLEKEINSHLYERIRLSGDKKGTLDISISKQEQQKPEDYIKDPYILAFAGLAGKEGSLIESDLEQALIGRLQDFMMELGKGFAFVGRQYRIPIEDGATSYYVDLVFYNYLLKCFVLIELKNTKLTHGDIGQMDFYVRYFEKEVKSETDNPTIGLILCADKNEAIVKYTLLEESKSIFASKYKLYLPTEAELKIELERERSTITTENRLNNLSS